MLQHSLILEYYTTGTNSSCSLFRFIHGWLYILYEYRQGCSHTGRRRSAVASTQLDQPALNKKKKEKNNQHSFIFLFFLKHFSGKFLGGLWSFVCFLNIW